MSNGSTTLTLAIAALAIGLLGGGVGGYALYGLTVEPVILKQPPEVIKQGLTPEELALMCVEQVMPETERAKAAQQRVMDLERDIASRESEIATLKAQDEKDEVRRKAAAKKWKAMEEELNGLRTQLAQATVERDEIKTKLEQTVRDLRRQEQETQKFKEMAKEYKNESTANRWVGFTAQAKVEICDRGTRNRHEKCHESVDAAMAPFEAKYKTCVDSYQAVPMLKQLDKKEPMPQFAERLPEDNKFTRKDWVIIFCDPSLPQSVNTELDDVQPSGRDGLDEGLLDDE